MTGNLLPERRSPRCSSAWRRFKAIDSSCFEQLRDLAGSTVERLRRVGRKTVDGNAGAARLQQSCESVQIERRCAGNFHSRRHEARAYLSASVQPVTDTGCLPAAGCRRMRWRFRSRRDWASKIDERHSWRERRPVNRFRPSKLPGLVAEHADQPAERWRCRHHRPRRAIRACMENASRGLRHSLVVQYSETRPNGHKRVASCA